MSKINASSYFNTPSALGGYTISQSLRFNDGDNAYLEFTPSTSGNRKTFSLSVWVKRGELSGNSQLFFGGGNSGSSSPYETKIGINDDNQVEVIINGNASIGGYYRSTRLLRDTSAWYHIVIAVDMSASGQSNKVKAWVNGESAAGSYNNLGTTNDTNVNTSGQRMRLGIQPHSASYGHDGYIAEAHFLDGTAVSNPDDFGVLENGIWLPKFYEGGSYGTNGFYMPFDDSSDIGADRSGNGNDFTATTLVASDVVLDSPSNNFATMNALDPPVGTSVTLSEGNLKVTGSTSSYSGGVASTFEFESGKWYWEVGINNEVSAGSNHYSFVGAATGESNEVHRTTNSNVPSLATGVDGWSWEGDGSILLIGTGTRAVTSVSAPSAGDVLGFAMDLDNGNVYFYLNGTAQNSGNAVITGVTGLKTNPMAGVYNSSAVTFNFGQDSSFAGTETAQGNTDDNGIGDFYHTPPSGYLAICTSNLPEPSISPINGEQPADYFNTVLYTGDGASSRGVTGVNFSPDWVWLKTRSTTGANFVYDTVRGATKGLHTNLSQAETTYTDGLLSFDSDGFSVGSRSNHNGSSTTMVSWNWLAGGTAVSNTEGSITSSVSANTKAGFSIVTWTATTGTVGHGLNSTPELIMEKKRGASGDWIVGTTVIDGTYDYMRLNTTAAKANAVVAAPTSTVFTPNTGASTVVAYCFHSVEGYSKIGTYTASNVDNGAYVYTGFRPAWVMCKSSSGGGNHFDWVIYDNKRADDNPIDAVLEANQNQAEVTGTGRGLPIDFLSNGFKVRNSYAEVGSSYTYIYLAFAEQPFKYSNAR
jgi:hypothetical protein